MSEALIWNDSGRASRNGFTYVIIRQRVQDEGWFMRLEAASFVSDFGWSPLDESDLKNKANKHADAITSALAKEREKLKVALEALHFYGGKLCEDGNGYEFQEEPDIFTGGVAREAIKQIEEGV